MNGLRFQDPAWMLLLIPLAILGLLAIRRQRRVAVLYSDVGVLASGLCAYTVITRTFCPAKPSVIIASICGASCMQGTHHPADTIMTVTAAWQ